MTPLTALRVLPVPAVALLLASAFFASAACSAQAAPVETAPRCHALAVLDNPDKQSGITIALVPVAIKKTVGGVISIGHELTAAAAASKATRLKADTGYFILKAKVTSPSGSAHVTVLELPFQTDQPSVLWPNSAAPPATDDVIAADGQWHTLLRSTDSGDQPAIYQAQKPYGKEVFKAFATREKTDFPSMLGSDPTRAPLTPIGMLVRQAMSRQTSAAPPIGPRSDCVVVQIVSHR